MKQFLSILVAATVCGCGFAQAPAEDVASVTKDVAAKVAQVNSFSATVETGEEADGSMGDMSQSSLLVSREFGWKMLGKEGPDAYQLVTDFNTFYQYFPNDKKAMKTVADKPEIKSMLTKPATDMNPLSLVSPQSIKFLGKETLDGETVYHVSGTTESQMMPGGPAVARTLSAWISVEDGLPRKTVESVGLSTGTTIYKNVKINPPVSAADFSFTPPEGVTVIDMNEEMNKQRSPGKK
jgi:outer membrane lipoprotein-sorting protein